MDVVSAGPLLTLWRRKPQQASGTSNTGDERSEEVNAMMKISVRKAGAIRLTANCYYCPGCRAG
jgi:hypothetical protein